MHSFQAAFVPPCLPSSSSLSSSRSANQEMNSSLHQLHQQQQQHLILSAATTSTSPLSSAASCTTTATFENTSNSSSINPSATVAANNLSSPQPCIDVRSDFTSPTSIMNQLHNFSSSSGIPAADPFASFPSSLSANANDFPAPQQPPNANAPNEPFSSAASFLNFIEEGQKMETKFTSILLESAIKVCLPISVTYCPLHGFVKLLLLFDSVGRVLLGSKFNRVWEFLLFTIYISGYFTNL